MRISTRNTKPAKQPTRSKKSTRSKSKYKNVKVTYEGEVFDSKFELEVYKQLVRLFGKERIKRQVKISLRKKTQNFRSANIIFDFGITKKDDPLDYACFFEAKGYLTTDCLIKLKWLESILPHSFEICWFVITSHSNNLPKSVRKAFFNDLQEDQDGFHYLLQERQ